MKLPKYRTQEELEMLRELVTGKKFFEKFRAINGEDNLVELLKQSYYE